MTEQTPAAPSAATAALSADGLALIDPRLADTTKDDAEIWNEIQADKTAAAKPAEGAGEPQGKIAPVTAEKVEPAPAKPADAGNADIWANASPEQKAAYDAERQRYRSSIGRISALTRKINAAQPSRDSATARDAIAGIKTDYPELAQPLEQALSRIDGKLDQITKGEQTSRDADVSEFNDLVAAETRRLVAKHPDYEDVLKKNGPAFAAWVEDQPKSIREAAYRNARYIADSDEAAGVVTSFKKHLGLIKDQPAPQPTLNDRRQRQIEGSASPQRTGGRPTVTGIPADGDEEGIWKAIQAEKAFKRA